jgi:SNF2-related domain
MDDNIDVLNLCSSSDDESTPVDHSSRSLTPVDRSSRSPTPRSSRAIEPCGRPRPSLAASRAKKYAALFDGAATDDDDDNDDDDDDDLVVVGASPSPIKPKTMPAVMDDDGDGVLVGISVPKTKMSPATARSARLRAAAANISISPVVKVGPTRSTKRASPILNLDMDDDDEDEDEMFTPLVAVTTSAGPDYTRAPPRGAAGSSSTPAAGAAGRVFSGAAVESDDNETYAEAAESTELADLVTDLSSGSGGFHVNCLFETEPLEANLHGGATEDELKALFDANNKNADATKEMDTPPALNVELMRHQRMALHWMVKRETGALEPHGGILADDQGFGKTLSAISLFLTNTPPPVERGHRMPWGTLIVCPLSLLAQWESELTTKVYAGMAPSVYIYHGPQRTKNPKDLVQYDVVLTTYSIISHEYPKILQKEGNNAPQQRRKRGPLFRMRWFRVLLDEAHAIKNRRSETFAAAFELKADRRWCLSGTPLQVC